MADLPMSVTLRSLAEKLTRRLVFRRYMPREFQRAPIYVSPAGGLKFIFRRMNAVDPILLRAAMLVRPGMTVWDVGANVGLFTVASAVRAGRAGSVFSFEPDAWVSSVLSRTVTAVGHAHAKIQLIPVAVAGSIALRQFHIAKRSRASNALAGYGHTQAGGVLATKVVPAFPLDWLLDHLEPPHILKIDVEGAEVEVLAGQRRMLTDIRPTIICEVGPSAAAQITRILREANFTLYNGERLATGAAPVSEACWSLIAVPKERAPEILLTP